MKLSQLENNIKNKKSFLCLGLDSDIDKIPKHLLSNSDPVFAVSYTHLRAHETS